MFKHLAGLIAAVLGVLVAFVIGLWALLCLAFVAIGAAIVHALRSRDSGRGRRRDRRHVIEGEFHVVDENAQDGKERDEHGHPGPPSTRG
ncbi:MAG: hypothetical protein ACRESR_01240 [Gammaproteobacteria bacterium]